MTSNRQEIDDLKAEVQRTKHELASAQLARDLAQVDFHCKRLLQLESQLSSLREQQTILLRSSQQRLSSPSSTEALNDSQVDQQPVLDATEQAADLVVGPLQSRGFAWLKISKLNTPAAFNNSSSTPMNQTAALVKQASCWETKGWCSTMRGSQVPACHLQCAQQQTG